MSRTEEITSEVRKLVLTCRTLEAQLQQSIPKKTHQEVIAKMQGAIDSLSADLGRTKRDLAETTSLGERINTLEATLAAQNDMISSQNNVIGALASRFSEALVLGSTYGEATQKIQTLEDRIASMVDRSQYDALVDANRELEERLASTVSKEQYYSLEDRLSNSVSKAAYDELEYRQSQMVPKEELTVAESKIQDLERALLNSVPRQDFEELASKMARLSAEAESARANAQQALQVASPSDAVSTSPDESAHSEAIAVAAVVDQPTAAIVVDSPAEVPIVEPVAFSEIAPEPVTDPQSQVATISEPESTISAASEVQTFVEGVAPQVQSEFSPIKEETKPSAEPAYSGIVAPVAASEDASQQTLDAPTFEPTPVEQTETSTDEATVEPTVSSISTPEVPTFTSPDEIAESAPAQAFLSEVEVTMPAPEETPSVAVETEAAVDYVQESGTDFAETQAPETFHEVAPQAVQTNEIREVQSQLAEINSASEAGETTMSPEPSTLEVEFDRGFRFTSTEFCARSGIEFIEDLEKVDAAIIEQHCKNGDFERWFQDVLADESAAAEIRAIREGNYTGDEIRTQLIATIAPHYRK